MESATFPLYDQAKSFEIGRASEGLLDDGSNARCDIDAEPDGGNRHDDV
jgi:hypothetical protein